MHKKWYIQGELFGVTKKTSHCNSRAFFTRKPKDVPLESTLTLTSCNSFCMFQTFSIKAVKMYLVPIDSFYNFIQETTPDPDLYFYYNWFQSGWIMEKKPEFIVQYSQIANLWISKIITIAGSIVCTIFNTILVAALLSDKKVEVFLIFLSFSKLS